MIKVLELVAITVIYYLIWRTDYRTDDSPFYGKGKFVLAGVYIALAFFSFICVTVSSPAISIYRI